MPPPPRPPKRKAPGLATATEEQVQSRSRGALLGLAVGDAFGTTNEGKRMQAPPFPLICEGVHTEMRGRGPFELRPGQVTDDTQMATVLAEGLREWRQYDWVYTARQYGKWLDVAFDCDPQVRSALEKIKEGRHPEIAGRQVWLESSQRAASNASLPRGVPLAVYFARDRKARIDATLQDAQSTHYAPHCQLAGIVLNAVIAAAITTPKEHLEHADAMKAIESELSIAAADLGRALSDFVIQIKMASDEIRADIAAAQNDDPLLYGPEVHMFSQDKWVRVALRLALWELWHAPNYEAALVDVANRGADADTNCAVTGALFGAVFGEGSIPERWATPVLEINGPGPLFRRYHPRELMLLAQNLPKPPEPPKAAAKK